MEVEQQAQIAFYLTGTRTAGSLHAIDKLKLRPALFAGYRDLSRLRYDFPVVLFNEGADLPYASLTSVIDGLCEKLTASGVADDKLHRQLLQLEQQIRQRVNGNATATLTKLWDTAADVLARSGAGVLVGSLAKARAALASDGEIADCTSTLPARLFMRSWRFVQERKARAFRAHIERLILKLSDILRADYVRSPAGRDAQQLKASVGTTFENAFDFSALSAMIAKGARGSGLPASRRRRIEQVLAVLEAQQFFLPAQKRAKQASTAYCFVYSRCAEVQKAHTERMPKMIEIAKAMAIAELEIKGEYNEAKHDVLFDAYGRSGLNADELAPFPDYLLCTHAKEPGAYGELMALLAAKVPVKVLVQFDDLVEPSPLGDSQVTLSLRSKQLADMAIGLTNVYVLQSAASNLVQMREAIIKGLSDNCPALYSVYSGGPEKANGLPPYLVAAAAMESRAFPAFTYDPSAGPNWAARFSVAENPQAESDWPVTPFSYEDGEHQRVAQDINFTLVDFMACDNRYARHFAQVPLALCNGNMVSVRDWLARKNEGMPSDVPYLMMVDDDDQLRKVIVDDKLIQEARRCADVWRSLQELGGIRNSHAEKLLAAAKQTWETEKQSEIAAIRREAKPAAAAAPAAAIAVTEAAPGAAAPAAAAQPAAAEEPSSDEPSIETPRCTTCEECMQINNKMFVYDDNKQAHIADLNAGTYRQLVEAAESCQVSIIHPGKPRNPNEPGLAELIERAAPFM